ncbi:MAG: DUF1559 domain-containing protein, partial [Planctomycetaceae bacterium]|nr:DUF1559 domain-containing protein [Planctomycetaceae bacterium]
RSQCTNKIKQIVLATHNYHSAAKVLPPGSAPFGSTANSYDRMRKNTFVCLLPFLEQEPLYNVFTGSFVTSNPGETTGGVTGTGSGQIWCAALSALHCPSDGNTKNTPTQTGRTSYRLCTGDWLDEPGRGPSFVQPRGVFVTSGRPSNRNNSVYRTLTGITDGTSNTICISEGVIGDGTANVTSSGTNPLRGGIAWRDTTGIPTCNGDPSATTTDITTCRDYKNGLYFSAGTYEVRQDRIGFRWGDAAPWYSLFSTVFPPNSPSCNNGNGGDERHPMLISASSNHSGGVICGIADGTVKFVSETIDASDSLAVGQNTRCVQSGKSPFGIWGALGSIEGNESVTLP